MPPVHAALPSLAPLLPELILGIGVLLLILYGAWRGERSAETVSVGALVLLLVALFAVLSQPGTGRVTTLSGAFVSDAFSKVMKSLVLLGSSAAIVLALNEGWWTQSLSRSTLRVRCHHLLKTS